MMCWAESPRPRYSRPSKKKTKNGVRPAICDSYRSFSLNRYHTDSSSVDHSLNLRRYRFGGTRYDVLIAGRLLSVQVPTFNASQTIVQLACQLGHVRFLDNVEVVSGSLGHFYPAGLIRGAWIGDDVE